MKDFIYNQREIPKERWRYGFRSSAVTGCGWIATYNAMRLMGYDVSPEEVIRYYHRSFPLINGNFGTFLPSLLLYFKRKNLCVKLTSRRKKFDSVLKESDVGILYYCWHNKYKLGAHYAVVRYENGKVVGYNTFRNSKGPDQYGVSLEAFLKRQKFFRVVLIGIVVPEKSL